MSDPLAFVAEAARVAATLCPWCTVHQFQVNCTCTETCEFSECPMTVGPGGSDVRVFAPHLAPQQPVPVFRV